MSTNVRRQLVFSDLSYRTTEQTLRNYFSTFGIIEHLVLYKDDQAQSLRNGYLVYTDNKSINDLMSKRPHFIDNREVYLRRRMPIRRHSCISESLGINLTVNEIFISRLCSGETQDVFVRYFQRFGVITNCRVFNSHSRNPNQMGYAFLRFNDYDSVGKREQLHSLSSADNQIIRSLFSPDQIILSRPHVIHSRFYHIRKCIPKEYNYIVSSVKPISSSRTQWRDYAFGLINMQTQTIIYPSLSRCTTQSVPTIPSNHPKSAVELPITQKSPLSNDFEIIPTSSLSSSISIINSIEDDFTPSSYSPTIDQKTN